MSLDLPHAHGGPAIAAQMRREPADFRVDEILGFEPSGSGEHVFLDIEKSGANTEWVARQLARELGLASVAVGFSGLKDRHAITRQAFTVHLGTKGEPDWSALAIPGVRVLGATRHARKLKRGAHRGNRFVIVLRDASGARECVDEVLAAVRAHGVPNYFGEQRFGRDEGNLALARQLFSGTRLPREKHGIALSAARSELFNAVLARRVAEHNWNYALDGEVFMLAGTHSVFGPETLTDELAQRVATFDIHPTGPLWGRGELRSAGVVRAIEESAVDAQRDLAEGLEKAGLEQQRRALRLVPRDLNAQWDGDDLTLSFALQSGAFATVVVREICATS